MALKQEPVDADADLSTPVIAPRVGNSSVTQTSFLQTEQPIFPPRAGLPTSERTVALPGGVVTEMTSPHTVIEHMTSPPANFLTDQSPGPVQMTRPDRNQDPTADVGFLPPRARGGRGSNSRDVVQYPTYSIAHNEAEVNSKFLPKKYRCRFCVYKTSYKSDLNRHLRKHGLAMQHCPLCNMPFKTIGNLENHVRHAHGEVGSPMYCAGMGLPTPSGGGAEGVGGAVPVAVSMGGEILPIATGNPETSASILVAQPSQALHLQQQQQHQQQQQLYLEQSSSSAPNPNYHFRYPNENHNVRHFNERRHSDDGLRSTLLTQHSRMSSPEGKPGATRVLASPHSLVISRGSNSGRTEVSRAVLDNRGRAGQPPTLRRGQELQKTQARKESMCLPHIPAVERTDANTKGNKRHYEPMSENNDDSSDVIVLSPDVTTVPIYIDEDESSRVESAEGDIRDEVSVQSESPLPSRDHPVSAARAEDGDMRSRRSQSEGAFSVSESSEKNSASLGESRRSSENRSSKEPIRAAQGQGTIEGNGGDQSKSSQLDSQLSSTLPDTRDPDMPGMAVCRHSTDVERPQMDMVREESSNDDHEADERAAASTDKGNHHTKRTQPFHGISKSRAAGMVMSNRLEQHSSRNKPGSTAGDGAEPTQFPQRFHTGPSTIKEEPAEVCNRDTATRGRSRSSEQSGNHNRGKPAEHPAEDSRDLHHLRTSVTAAHASSPSQNKKRRICLEGPSQLEGKDCGFENEHFTRTFFHREATVSSASSRHLDPASRETRSPTVSYASSSQTLANRTDSSNQRRARPSHSLADRVYRQPPSSGRYAQLVSDFDEFSAKPYACSLCFFRTGSLGELRVHCENHLTGCNTKPIPETALFHSAPARHADSATSPVSWMSSRSCSPSENFQGRVRSSGDAGTDFARAPVLRSGRHGDDPVSPESESEGEHDGQMEDMDSDFDMDDDLSADGLHEEENFRMMYTTTWSASDRSDNAGDDATDSEAFRTTEARHGTQRSEMEGTTDKKENCPTIEDRSLAMTKEEDAGNNMTETITDRPADDDGHYQQTDSKSSNANQSHVTGCEDAPIQQGEPERTETGSDVPQPPSSTTSCPPAQKNSYSVHSQSKLPAFGQVTAPEAPKLSEEKEFSKCRRKINREVLAMNLARNRGSMHEKGPFGSGSERLFKCGLCQKKFSLRPILARHLKTIHGSTSGVKISTHNAPENVPPATV